MYKHPCKGLSPHPLFFKGNTIADGYCVRIVDNRYPSKFPYRPSCRKNALLRKWRRKDILVHLYLICGSGFKSKAHEIFRKRSICFVLMKSFQKIGCLIIWKYFSDLTIWHFTNLQNVQIWCEIHFNPKMDL